MLLGDILEDGFIAPNIKKGSVLPEQTELKLSRVSAKHSLCKKQKADNKKILFNMFLFSKAKKKTKGTHSDIEVEEFSL